LPCDPHPLVTKQAATKNSAVTGSTQRLRWLHTPLRLQPVPFPVPPD
jgi:hypothetical protein